MSALTGDYSSLAEAVGEAPPRSRFNTGSELAELEHDCAGDQEMMDHILDYAAHEDARNRDAWYREHFHLGGVSDQELMAEAQRRGLLDD